MTLEDSIAQARSQSLQFFIGAYDYMSKRFPDLKQSDLVGKAIALSAISVRLHIANMESGLVEGTAEHSDD